MDKANEINKLLDQLGDLINTCDKTTYTAHWDALEESIARASYIVFNFDKAVDQLDTELEKRKASEEKFKSRLKVRL